MDLVCTVAATGRAERRRGVAVRSYPSPKAGGSSGELQAAAAQGHPREERPRARVGGGGLAELTHARGQGRWRGTSPLEVRGPAQEELPRVQGQEGRP